MLKTLTLSTPITPVMANFIIYYSPESLEWTTPNYHTGSSTSKVCRNFKGLPILEVNIWFNVAKMISEPFSTPNCLMNVVVDAEKFTGMDNIIAEMYALIPDYPKNKDNYLNHFITDFNFEVKGATFVYNFEGTLIKEYYKLIKGGYDLGQIHLKKEVRESIHKPNYIYTTEYVGTHDDSDPEKPSRYTESLRMKAELYMEGKKVKGDCPIKYVAEYKRTDRLHIKFNLKRNKIARICNQLQITRNPDIFLKKAEKIDSIVFHDYMKYITGEGRHYRFDVKGRPYMCSDDKECKFYSYKEAEKIIDSTEMLTEKRNLTHKRKQLMKDVLKSVASYKSISTYLDHVEDAEITYPCMESVRTRKKALALLKDLQRIGICPLNLSVRSKMDELKPLVQVYKEAISDTTKK